MNIIDLYVGRMPDKRMRKGNIGLWLSAESFRRLPVAMVSSVWWWLPPVIWPDDEKAWEELLDSVLKKGAKNFVSNTPWQIAFFPNPKNLNVWAGPFCNIANVLAAEVLAKSGFSGVIVSPELSRADYLALPQNSPLPLGIVIAGSWPLSISRIFSDCLKPHIPFSSPKGEQAYTVKHGSDYWTYPNWHLDLSDKKAELSKAGYGLFAYLEEPVPDPVMLKDRPGLWNWGHELL